ncbi:MAG: glutathione S-transferase family protein [Caulobacteraceae bacterium]|nr:glutathione S-transferase family protein [Caulobacteraceae bacterium]
MLTLYHAPRSRSSRFIWLLEETGAPYEVAYVGIARPGGEGAPDPANVHPDKKVPALVHDGVLITESTAIALYLADAFPEKALGPKIGDPQRGPFVTWLAYYAGVLEPVIMAHFQGRTQTDPVEKQAYEALDARFRTALEAGPYLLGERFSAADVMFVSLLLFARNALPPHKVYDDYVARLTARPAFQRAMAKDSPPG